MVFYRCGNMQKTEAIMMRSAWVFVLVPLLGACATASGPTIDATIALSRLPDGCAVRPVLTGPVVVDDMTGTSKPSPGEVRLSVYKVESDQKFGTICVCQQSFDMAKFKEKDAEQVINGLMSRGDFKLTKASYEDRGTSKVTKFTGNTENFMGTFSGRGFMISEGKCLQIVNGWILRGHEDKLEQQIASAYDIRTSRPVFAPSSSASVSTPVLTSTESRLATIKDLLDRRVITQQEYDERRRAILGSL